uniref:G_PROTEIN_RECEP_F1_2 domain-containing protein n=1 Tax=Parastrongyloides trichosuri TaxID=131310 RepID=A0A0N5A2R3_PARTI
MLMPIEQVDNSSSMKDLSNIIPSTHDNNITSIIISCCMLIIVIVGFSGNGLIAFIFARDPKLRKKFFLLIIISILYAFGSLFFSLDIYHLYHHITMKDPICTLHAYAISTLSVGGIHQLTILSLERYVGINYPFLLMRQKLSTKMLFAFGAFTWTLVTTTPPLLGWSAYKPLGDSLHYCVFDYLSKEKITQLYILYLFFNGYIAPLTLIGFSNYKIFITTKGMIRSRKSDICSKQSTLLNTSTLSYNDEEVIFRDRPSKQYKNSISSNNSKKIYREANKSLRLYDKQQRKCARVIFYCVGSFIISWTPYAYASIVSNIIFGYQLNSTFVLFTAIAAKMFVIWNPIIYGFMDITFRKECGKLFSKIIC